MKCAEDADIETEVECNGLEIPTAKVSIIEKLIAWECTERKKKQIIATEAGSKKIALMPEHMKSTQMTAVWKNRLLAVEPDNFLGLQAITVSRCCLFIGNVVHEITGQTLAIIGREITLIFRKNQWENARKGLEKSIKRDYNRFSALK